MLARAAQSKGFGPKFRTLRGIHSGPWAALFLFRRIFSASARLCRRDPGKVSAYPRTRAARSVSGRQRRPERLFRSRRRGGVSSVNAWLLAQRSLVCGRNRGVLPAVLHRNQLVTTLKVLLDALGLQRRAKQIPTLEQYIARPRSEATENGAQSRGDALSSPARPDGEGRAMNPKRLAERIAATHLLPQVRQDHHQDPQGDPQDCTDSHGSSRVVRLQEPAGGAHAEDRDSDHRGNGDDTEGELDCVRIEVVQCPSVWPVRRGSAT